MLNHLLLLVEQQILWTHTYILILVVQILLRLPI